ECPAPAITPGCPRRSASEGAVFVPRQDGPAARSSLPASDGRPRTARARSGRSEPTRVEPFDWRRPSKFGREHVRALTHAHEAFSRRLSTALGALLRGLVQVELFGIDQMTYDDYARSLPNPNVNALVRLPDLPGDAV